VDAGLQSCEFAADAIDGGERRSPRWAEMGVLRVDQPPQRPGTNPAARLGAFMALTRWEVEREANRLRAKSAAGPTWVGLSNLMERRAYRVVGDLGAEAAAVWAVHLGVIQRDADPEPRAAR
jgi:hypothetical protein